MDQINSNTAREDLTNMDFKIDFYDPKDTARFGLDPLPTNKNYDDFKKIYLKQITLQRDSLNKNQMLLIFFQSGADFDPILNLTKEEAKTLFIKGNVMQVIYSAQIVEIINVLKSLSDT